MSKRLIIFIVIAVILFGSIFFIKSANIGSSFIWGISSEGRLFLPLVAVAALIDSINPCAFSVLLLTIAFLFSLGSLGSLGILKEKILKIGAAYIIGLFIVYLLIGLGILGALNIFNAPNFMAKVGAGLLIVLGLINLLAVFFPKFPIKFKIPAGLHQPIAKLMKKASLPASFGLGALVGLFEFPCTGGPYLMILGLLHDSATYLKGFGYLLIYNLIFILPLVIILLIAGNKALLEKIQDWRKNNVKKSKLIVGSAMIALGLIILLV